MTDRKPDALVPSSRPGALTTAPTGDLVSRGLEDLKALEQIVVFPDKHLEAVVRRELKKPEGPLTRADLESLEELEAEGREIEDLTGLEHCVNLTWLRLDDNQISDLTPLASLANVTHLWLGFNQISDITPLASLTNLTELDFEENPLSQESLEVHVPTLESRGVAVILDDDDD